MIASSSYADKLRALFSNLTINVESELDTFCKDNYTLLPNIAYRNKRKIGALGSTQPTYYTISLNELITPNAYAIIQFKKRLVLNVPIPDRAFVIGNKMASTTLWTDDKNLDKSGDYYLYPVEILALAEGDCEDIALATASCDPEFGCVWGFLTKDGVRFGHCWNCYVWKNELYYMDNTGNTARLIKASDHPEYAGSYIVTREYTYQIGPSVEFGVIAGW